MSDIVDDSSEEPKQPAPDGGGTRPFSKTPMYTALHAARYQRQEMIKEIDKAEGTHLICYVGSPEAMIDRNDIIGFVDMLHNIPDGSRIDLMLHTCGGDVDACEKLISFIHSRTGDQEFRIIVPDLAKSAGTLMALGAVVSSLRKAGAVIIGKLRMSEAGSFSHHPQLPRPSNPWNPDLWPGTSSSGSAVATSAGLCFASLCSDTGGSIRMPAAACGLSAIKPTWGRVSRKGLFPVAESFDHIGPMARSVSDAAAILQVIAGEDRTDPTTITTELCDLQSQFTESLDGFSIGVDPYLIYENVDPVITANINDCLSIFTSLGTRIRNVHYPRRPIMAGIVPLMTAEMLVAHLETFAQKPEDYGLDLRASLEANKRLSCTDVARAFQRRRSFAGALRKMFFDIDALLTPAAPAATPVWLDIDAMKNEPETLMDRVARYTFPFNVSGNPTLSLPSGFNSSGSPLGIQLVGRHEEEAKLCVIGHAFQKATKYHITRPALYN